MGVPCFDYPCLFGAVRQGDSHGDIPPVAWLGLEFVQVAVGLLQNVS